MTVNRGDGGSIPPVAVSKLRQFRSFVLRSSVFRKTLKAGSPFYLVPMPGEIKEIHTQKKTMTIMVCKLTEVI